MSSSGKGFKMRQAEEKDFDELARIIFDTRMEHFPAGYRRTILSSYKIQSLFIFTANLIPPMLGLHLSWFLLFYPLLLIVAWLINFWEWRRKIREIAPELKSWDRFHETYGRDRGCIFIVATHRGAEDGGGETIAGCAGMRLPVGEIRKYVKRPGASYEVVRVGVVAKFRGRGLAKQLMHECELHATRNGDEEGRADVVLETSEVQDAAIGMYKKLNYSNVDVVPVPFLCGIGAVRVLVFLKTLRTVN